MGLEDQEREEEDSKRYDLRIPPGTPNMEELLSEVTKKFDLKVVAPTNLDDPYYIALRGPREACEAAKEYMRKRLEQMVADLEKKTIEDR